MMSFPAEADEDGRQAPVHTDSPCAGKDIGLPSLSQINVAADKSCSLTSFIKESSIVQKCAHKVGTIAQRDGRNGIANVAASLKTGVVEKARLAQYTLRDSLSKPDQGQAKSEPGIVHKAVYVKDRGSLMVADLMEELWLEKLGGDKRMSKDQMMTYITMGERICGAVRSSIRGQPPLETTVNGKTIIIPSTLDTARAISWYLQAKALVDNADTSRDPVSVGKSGSMLIKDLDRKLYNFLSAAPNAYGRTSTHLKYHSHNAAGDISFADSFRKTGIISALTVYYGGGALQLGIEDYSRKLPGARGTILFDSIKPDSSGVSLLFMKLEPVGMPTSFSHFGCHVDPADGFARHVQALVGASHRNLLHGVYLVKSTAARHFTVKKDYRGERVDKGPSKVIYKEFCSALDGADWLEGAYKKEIIDIIKKNGVTGLLGVVNAIEEHARQKRVQIDLVKPFYNVRSSLVSLVHAMGADLGIDRRGNEVHVTYL